MSSQKTEIKKIVLEVEGEEIVLTVEGAKKLKALLNEIFGKDIIKEIKIVERDVYIPDPYLPKPYPWKPYWEYPDKIWMGDNGNAKYLCSSNTLKCFVKD